MRKRYTINAEHVVHEAIDGEAVLVNLQTGNYYSTAGTGAVIWEDLQRGLQPEALLLALERRYEGETAAMEEGLHAFLERLLDEQLILPAGNSDDPAEGLRDMPEEPPPGADGKLPFSPPRLQRYSDMQELLLLDPIHDVDGAGWPMRPAPEDS